MGGKKLTSKETTTTKTTSKENNYQFSGNKYHMENETNYVKTIESKEKKAKLSGNSIFFPNTA